MNVLPRFASACRRHRAAREAPGGGSVSPVARCSCCGISLSRETDICIQRRIARTNVVKTAPREQSRKCFSGWRHGTVSGKEEIAEQWPRDREWCSERCQNQYSNTGIPLRANISETVLVLLNNEQKGENEEIRDEREFSWC